VNVKNDHLTATISLGTNITGTNQADFTVTGGICTASLPAKESCTYIVTFKPTAGLGASESATLVITANPDLQSPHIISLKGTEMKRRR